MLGMGLGTASSASAATAAMAHAAAPAASDASLPATNNDGALRIYTSSQGATQQMRASTAAAPVAGHALTEKENSIFVNPQRQFQQVLGIGGAITDSSAETFAKLPKRTQRALLTAYY
ncbi:glycosyl hydrolase, partial [Xanthomonas perforans]|nr:glycosyl hydrolase [Xanthomonas perforans]MCF5954315.1 glycosyl hydrolase [Xanthomonas perforans]